MVEHWKNYSLVDIEGEEWKDVIGFEGLYKISNMGRVKSLGKYVNGKNSSLIFRREQIIKSKKQKKGYLLIKLSNITQKHLSVHRLVAKHFIPNPNNLPHVNHKKGIKTDCRATELEWMTRSENVQHSFDLGLNPKGEKSISAKLTQQQVDEIRAKYNSKMYTMRKLALIYNVTFGNIGHIINYRSWK